jgi:magnesium-transporting ATPase (P-type)
LPCASRADALPLVVDREISQGAAMCPDDAQAGMGPVAHSPDAACSPASDMAAGPQVAARGLSASEAAARLGIDGPNVLPVPRRSPAWRRLAAEMVHFFALLFWVAGALAFIAGLPQLGVAVFFVIVLNGLFAFVQEQRAEHATERLRDLLPRRATVVRDGRPVEIAAEELVVGDAVLLAEGDRVSADLRLDVVHALALDTSSLTDESVSTHPALGDVVYVLGPVEAFGELAAFLGVFIAAGWRPGDTFPHGSALLAASGAAFTAVVLGQVANAFACRSTVRPVWRIGWATNRLLLGAIVAELGMLAGFLYVPPLADLLDQAPPSWVGFVVALLAIPAVLIADTAQKAVLRRRRGWTNLTREHARTNPLTDCS